MKKFLFVSLPKHDLTPSAAIGALNGVALKLNCKTEIIDFNFICKQNLSNKDFNEIDDWLMFVKENISNILAQKICNLWSESVESQEEHFDYICISVFTYYSLNIARLLLEYHNRLPRKTPIIVGGCGCAWEFPDTKIHFKTWCKPYVDSICINQDGEQYIANIINKQIDYNNDISLYPIPNYNGFNFNNYHDKKIYITGSKGCVRDCTFCDVAALWPKFRYRKAENLVQEIKEQFYNYGITTFDFTDSLINGSVSNFYKFNCLMAEEKQKDPALKNVKYMGQAICRPRKQMPPTHYEAMYYAGCTQITVGIESFSKNVRYHMRKKFENEDIDYHIEQCSFYDINNVWLMIVGYPTETIEDHKENIKALYRYVKYVKNGTIELIRWGFTMSLLQDTPIVQPKYIEELQIHHNDTSASQGNLGGFYGWFSQLNNTNTLNERIRRRVELHEISIKLGYPQPRVRQELNTLLSIAEQISN